MCYILRVMKSFVLKQKAGFTLIELLIVLTIVAIIASLAIPRFLGQQERGHVAEAVNILGTVRRGQETYFNDHSGVYKDLGAADVADSAKWGELGMEPPTRNFWTFTTSASARTATATRNGTALGSSGCTLGTTIVLSFQTGSTSDLWSGSTGCYSTGGAFHPTT